MNAAQCKEDLNKANELLTALAREMRNSSDELVQDLGSMVFMFSSKTESMSVYYGTAKRLEEGHLNQSRELKSMAALYCECIDQIIVACGAYAGKNLDTIQFRGDSWLLSLKVFSKFAKTDSDARFALLHLMETM